MGTSHAKETFDTLIELTEKYTLVDGWAIIDKSEDRDYFHMQEVTDSSLFIVAGKGNEMDMCRTFNEDCECEVEKPGFYQFKALTSYCDGSSYDEPSYIELEYIEFSYQCSIEEIRAANEVAASAPETPILDF